MSESKKEAVAIDTNILLKGRNERGIPEVVFIEDVSAFLATLETSVKAPVPVETAIGAFNELYSKYKLFESNLERTKSSMKQKIPEIQSSLDLVGHLIEKQHNSDKVQLNYALADTVYAKAELSDSGVVCIWLGANVMLEYTYDEAVRLLKRSLLNAQQKLEETAADLQFLRDNIITVEVNMARIFNWDVKKRREKDKKG